tara:strand:- start:15997 stop:16242 length:246 start_codon:yes stop_codon:yes gene_type:complete
MPKKIEDLSYEETVEKITNITSYLERDDLSIDESIEAFSYGVKLSNHAKKLLNSAEDKIKKVLDKEHVDDSKKLKSKNIFD